MAEANDAFAFVGHIGETEPADVASFAGEAHWTTPHLVHIEAGATDAEGSPLHESMFTDYNDHYDLHIEGQSLVGRSEGDHGPARTILPEAPLYLEDGKLKYDAGAIDALLLMIIALQDTVAALTTTVNTDRKNRWIG